MNSLLRSFVALLAMVSTFWPGVQAAELIYVSMSNNTIATFDVSSGVAATIEGSKKTFATGVELPQGLAFDSSGNLYAANAPYPNETGKISKFTPGGTVSLFASGLNNPQGLAFDSSGNLYAANSNNDTISRITSGGVVSIFASRGELRYPMGLAFNSSGKLYVANNSSYTISELDSNGAFTTTWSSGTSSLKFLAFAPTVVPEPSTYALSVIAAGVMAFVALRNKARNQA